MIGALHRIDREDGDGEGKGKGKGKGKKGKMVLSAAFSTRVGSWAHVRVVYGSDLGPL